MHKYKKEIIWSILIVILLAPIMYTILFSIPSADDFSMATNIAKENLLMDSVNKMNTYYWTWSGSWFYIFLECFLNPVVLFGASSNLIGVELLFFFILFICSLMCLIMVFGEKVLKLPRYKTFIVAFAFMVVFINTEIYSEVYYWFVGSSYMWGVTLSLFTTALIILYWKNGCKIHTALAVAVVGFFACIAYQCAVFPGIIYLLFWIKKCDEKKGLKIKELVPLGCMVIGGLSNVLAPGNFARHDAGAGTGLQFVDAIKFAWEDLILVLGDWFKNPIVIVGMVTFILIGILIGLKSDYEYRWPILPFLVSVACCYIICYPVALGYSKVAMPNRQFFVVNIYAMLSFCISFLYLGGWISKKVRVNVKKLKAIMIVLVMLAFISLIPGKRYESVPYYETIANVGTVKAVAEEWRKAFKEIETSNEKELVVRAEYFAFDPPVLRATQLTGKVDFWVNMAVAQYYGADSLIIEYYNTPWGY